jgi:hypothetical protein
MNSLVTGLHSATIFDRLGKDDILEVRSHDGTLCYEATRSAVSGLGRAR